MKVAVDVVLICLLCAFGDVIIRCSAAPEPTLAFSELQTLRSIASKLRVGPELWDFNVNPCSGKGGWLDVPKINFTAAVTKNLTCGDCNHTTGVCHVVGIVLKSTNLTGVLPSEFANLTHLSVVDLSRNVLTGSIPVAWGSLPLVTLILLGNRISGRIPDEIGDISTLEVLNLEDNLLEGSIPRSVGKLTRLSRLLLSANNFEGELPDAMGNITNLSELILRNCSISGPIPPYIGFMSNLLILFIFKGHKFILPK